MSPLPRDWPSLMVEHSAAIDEFITAATRCRAGAWIQPIGPGKWTPAEVTSHIAEAYRVLAAELAGAPGMRMLGSPLQRLVLRYTILPRLLAGRPFPPGVRAPRETRPREIVEDPAAALGGLRALADGFTRDMTSRASQGAIRLTHAYFGPLTPRQGLQLLTVHTRHHARQLAGLAG